MDSWLKINEVECLEIERAKEEQKIETNQRL